MEKKSVTEAVLEMIASFHLGLSFVCIIVEKNGYFLESVGFKQKP